MYVYLIGQPERGLEMLIGNHALARTHARMAFSERSIMRLLTRVGFT